MPFSTTPAALTDAPALELVTRLALANDRLVQSRLPLPLTSVQQAEYIAWRTNAIEDRLRQPGVHIFKAINNETGEIVGLAGWIEPGFTEPESRNTGMPTWTNENSYTELEAKFREAKERVIGSRKVWYLQALFVHPNFHRRGIAKQLLEAGFKLVDRDGLECYVEATPAGLSVYERFGFEIQARLPMLGGKYTTTTLLRRAQGESKEA